MAATPNSTRVGVWRPALREAPTRIGTWVEDVTRGGSATWTVPFVAFCVLTFVIVGRPNDYIPALVPLRLALVMTAVTVAATLLLRRASASNPLQHRETKLYLTLFAAMLFGIPFAMHRGVSFNAVVVTYSSNIIYFLLFVTLVDTRAKFQRVADVLVLGGLVFTLVGLYEGTFRFNRFVTGSGMFDPNDVAYVELTILPFALGTVLGRSGTVRRALGLTTVVGGVLLGLYTGSRGGLLGFLTFLLLFIGLHVGGVKRLHKILLLAVLAVTVVMNVDKINTERYLTLTNIQDDYNLSDEAGRRNVWRTGILLFLQDPLTGVGADNFGMAIGTRRDALGLTPRWQAPHNSFIQVLTEIGLVGIVAWCLLIATCLRTFWSLRERRAGSRKDEVAIWSGVLFVGFVAQLLTAMFLTMAYSIYFTLIFAVSAALRHIATSTGEPDGGTGGDGGGGAARPPAVWRPALRQ